MLKLATKEDVADIVLMAQRFHASSNQEDQPFDEHKVYSFIDALLSSGGTRSIIILACNDEMPFGFIVGVINENLFNRDLVATELAWWVEPEFRKTPDSIKLVEAYEYWASMMGARQSHLTVTTSANHDVLCRFYKNRGYTHKETSFIKDL